MVDVEGQEYEEKIIIDDTPEEYGSPITPRTKNQANEERKRER